MSDKLKRPTFEQLINGEVDDTSIIGSAMVDFVVDFAAEPKGEGALDIARRRWRCEPELLSGGEHERQ